VVDNCNALKYHFDAVVALEARGFLFGLKHEKLPGKLITISYEISSKCKKTTYCKRMLANVLLFDDILATGGNL
ncbi:hypothetical protein D917_06646, partial [Trichinella nativa]